MDEEGLRGTTQGKHGLVRSCSARQFGGLWTRLNSAGREGGPLRRWTRSLYPSFLSNRAFVWILCYAFRTLHAAFGRVWPGALICLLPFTLEHHTAMSWCCMALEGRRLSGIRDLTK